jgi:3-hydroxyisobutyrate dehydrogenase
VGSQSRKRHAPGEDGAYLADSPADAARGAGIVLTMLADADEVIAVMDGDDGALSAMSWADGDPPGRHPAEDPYGSDHALWVQMSPVGEAATRRCEGLANQRGVGFVDAPVDGTPEAAERGELVVLESGPEEARPRVQQVFDAIARRTVRAGEAGEGTRLKGAAGGQGRARGEPRR